MRALPSRTGRRFASVLAGLTVLLAGCAGVVDGHGAGSPGPASSAPISDGPSGTPSVPTSTDPSGPSSVTSSAPSTGGGAVLVPLLVHGPEGSNAWNDDWGRNITPTIDELVDHLYSAASHDRIVKELRTEGLTGVAHRTWIARSQTQADVILFLYSTQAGAESRYTFAVNAKADTAGIKHFTTPASPHALLTYYKPTKDSDGFIDAITYTRVQNVVVEVFTFSPGKLSTSEIVQWSQAQVALLR